MKSSSTPLSRGMLSGRRLAVVAALAALAGTTASRAADWELDVDARVLTADGGKPFIDGGLGTTRFGSHESGLRLGRARVAVSQNLGEVWTLHLDASSWGDRDKTPVGLTEGYLQFRPYPASGYRLRVKAGAFYPPVSLENRSSGWESPYTLSYSAINSWLGEELRTIGLETQLDWLGTRTGHGFDLGVTGGVFGWNDAAGVALANGGFTLTDRQTLLGGRVGQPGVAPLFAAVPFREIDGRAGAYAGLEARYLDRVVLRLLRYDNNADPAARDPVTHVIGWNTRFNSAGLRVEGQNGWTAIVQWLDGNTYIEPHGAALNWPFKASFALLSRRIGSHLLSVRYDRFEVDSETGAGESDGTQKGHAWTAAYVYRSGPRWRYTLEWLRVVSDSYNRADYLGAAALATETQVQLAIRYALGPLAQ
jgi:hypothetical protein